MKIFEVSISLLCSFYSHFSFIFCVALLKLKTIFFSHLLALFALPFLLFNFTKEKSHNGKMAHNSVFFYYYYFLSLLYLLSLSLSFDSISWLKWFSLSHLKKVCRAPSLWWCCLFFIYTDCLFRLKASNNMGSVKGNELISRRKRHHL